MGDNRIEVLLLGESDDSFSYVRAFLERRGCRCSFAKSFSASLANFTPHSFQLILSAISGPLDHAFLSHMAARQCDAFSALRVENGYWWLPIMREGEHCLGSPALRSREFIPTLERTLQDIANHQANHRSYFATAAFSK